MTSTIKISFRDNIGHKIQNQLGIDTCARESLARIENVIEERMNYFSRYCADLNNRVVTATQIHDYDAVSACRVADFIFEFSNDSDMVLFRLIYETNHAFILGESGAAEGTMQRQHRCSLSSY